MRALSITWVFAFFVMTGCASSSSLQPYDMAVERSAPPRTTSDQCLSSEVLLCTNRGPEKVCRCADRNQVLKNVRNMLPFP